MGKGKCGRSSGQVEKTRIKGSRYLKSRCLIASGSSFFSAASSLPHLRCADCRSDISLLQNQPDSVRHGIHGSMIGKVTLSCKMYKSGKSYNKIKKPLQLLFRHVGRSGFSIFISSPLLTMTATADAGFAATLTTQLWLHKPVSFFGVAIIHVTSAA